METKLTLKLDLSAIDSAKEYAKGRHKSLSKLVEDFFKSLAYDNSPAEKYPPLIEKLSGIISEEDLKRVSREDERVHYTLRDVR